MLETICALALLLFITSAIFPFLSLLYKEKLTIAEEREHLYLIEEAVHHYTSGYDWMITDKVRKEDVSANAVRFCTSFTGTNGREYERCLLANR